MLRGSFWVVALATLGCSRAQDGPSGQTPPTSSAAPVEPRAMHVGNQAKGVKDQPDWNLEAQKLRGRIEGRLPAPLPKIEDACSAMLEAVHEHYRTVEGEGAVAVVTVAATREQDLAACIERTSAAAAMCVALAIQDRQEEYPWLLDQCSRAFPRS